jgi:hypothetical protein
VTQCSNLHIFTQRTFPPDDKVFRSERVYHNVMRGSCALIAKCHLVSGFKGRLCLEFIDESVWTGSRNLCWF